MSSGNIAPRYAKALLNLARKHACLEEIEQELEVIVSIYQKENSSFAKWLHNPKITFKQKQEALKKIVDLYKGQAILKQFLLLLLVRNRINLLPRIAYMYNKYKQDLLGQVKTRLEVPFSLSEENKQILIQKITEYMKKEVILIEEINPDLITGFRAHTGTLLFDASLQTQLNRLSQTLLEG